MTTDAVGGVWQYSLDLCRFLTEAGVEVQLAVMGPVPGAGQRPTADAIDGVTLIDTALPLDWLAADEGAVVEAGRRISELAGDHSVDLVHLNTPALAAQARFSAPVLTVAHSCLGTWWDAVRSDPLPADFAWRDALHAQGLARADLACAPSHSFAQATAKRHGLPQLPRAIHNGRAALPSTPGAIHDFAFTAGRLWDAGKNVATLDRAAAHLAIPFKAAGKVEGENGERLAFDHLALVGQLDEAGLGALLGARPVFASAALYEPFGLAVLEAAAAGCPLVLSDIPTFRELWAGAAIFVPPHDAAGFAEAIDALIGDAGKRVTAGEAARARAARYSVAAMGEATLDAYRTLCRRGARVAA